jgi:sRNA-binding carbon storage regulator CsrA
MGSVADCGNHGRCKCFLRKEKIMLRLRRKFGQSIVMHTEQGDVEITVDRATGNACFMMITAPKDIIIRRKELSREDNKEVSSSENYTIVCCDCESEGTSNFWRVPQEKGGFKTVCHVCKEKYTHPK